MTRTGSLVGCLEGKKWQWTPTTTSDIKTAQWCFYLFVCLSPFRFVCLSVHSFVRLPSTSMHPWNCSCSSPSASSGPSNNYWLFHAYVRLSELFLVKHRGKLLHENCLNFIYCKLLYHFKHTMRILYVYIINLYRNAYTTIISLYAYNCLWFIYRYSIGYKHTNIYRIYGHLVTQFVWNFITTLIRNIWFQFNKFVGRKVSKEKICYIKKNKYVSEFQIKTYYRWFCVIFSLVIE